MLSTVRTPCDVADVHIRKEVPDCERRKGRWVLAAAILGSTITFVDGTVVNIMLPVLQRELNTSVAEAQWIVESYALLLAALLLVGGALGDRRGRRRIFMIGTAIFGAASLWCALSTSVVQLILARAVQGIGAALLVPGSLALISASFSKAARGRAIGIWSGFTAIGAGLGPLLGGWLIERFSWRAVFYINLPLVLLVLLISWRHVPESRDPEAPRHMDWPGAVLATIGLGGIVLALIEYGSPGARHVLVTVSLVVGAAALVAFLIAESRRAHPMLPLTLFRSRTFAGANLLTLFLYAALGALMFFLPFNLIQVQGYRPTAAGAALLPFVFTMFLFSGWAGGLVNRFGSKLPLTIGPFVAAAGFLLFARPGPDAGSYWTSFFPAILLLSIGMTITVAPLTTTVLGAIDVKHAGIASGINNVVARAAALLAIAAFGVILLSTFGTELERRVHQLDLNEQQRSQLLAQRSALANAPLPVGVNHESEKEVRRTVRAAFVSGFRRVAVISAVLALLSALVSWLWIEGKPKSVAMHARVAAD